MFDTYQTSKDNKARYIIGITGSKPLHIIGLNPSTASRYKSDTTISKIRTFSSLNNYDGFMVYNLYPERSTNPDNLPQRINKEILDYNLDIIYKQISSSNQFDVCAAWGQMIKKRKYLIDCLQKIYNRISPLHSNWITIGETTKEGHPRHPSRISYKSIFKSFNIESYIDKLR